MNVIKRRVPIWGWVGEVEASAVQSLDVDSQVRAVEAVVTGDMYM